MAENIVGLDDAVGPPTKKTDTVKDPFYITGVDSCTYTMPITKEQVPGLKFFCVDVKTGELFSIVLRSFPARKDFAARVDQIISDGSKIGPVRLVKKDLGEGRTPMTDFESAE